MSKKFAPGTPCPDITISTINGKSSSLSHIAKEGNWKLIVFYRGLHCPLCISYIKELDAMIPDFTKSNVEILAISGDPLEKAQKFAQEPNLQLNLGYDLSVSQMHQLGLYVSEPFNPNETDRPFCEPGIFILNAEQLVHIVSISNAPFARPELKQIKRALDYIRLAPAQRHDNYGVRYPIRGQHKM